MAKKFMMTATEVMDELGESRAFAYKLIDYQNNRTHSGRIIVLNRTKLTP